MYQGIFYNDEFLYYIFVFNNDINSTSKDEILQESFTKETI
jgi:hypothetical protein